MSAKNRKAARLKPAAVIHDAGLQSADYGGRLNASSLNKIILAMVLQPPVHTSATASDGHSLFRLSLDLKAKRVASAWSIIHLVIPCFLKQFAETENLCIYAIDHRLTGITLIVLFSIRFLHRFCVVFLSIWCCL